MFSDMNLFKTMSLTPFFWKWKTKQTIKQWLSKVDGQFHAAFSQLFFANVIFWNWCQLSGFTFDFKQLIIKLFWIEYVLYKHLFYETENFEEKKKLTPTDSAVSKLPKKKNVSWVASGEKSFLKDSVLCWFNLTRENGNIILPISTHIH